MFKTDASLIYYFNVYNDYRSGPDLVCFHENDTEYDESDMDECRDIELDLPSTGVIAYVIDDFCTLKILLSKQFESIDDAKNFLLQTYCMFNKCTPFVVTGQTSSYKDEGSYGAKIKVTYDEILNLDINSIESYVYGIIIDTTGEILYSISIKLRE